LMNHDDCPICRSNYLAGRDGTGMSDIDWLIDWFDWRMQCAFVNLQSGEVRSFNLVLLARMERLEEAALSPLAGWIVLRFRYRGTCSSSRWWWKKIDVIAIRLYVMLIYHSCSSYCVMV
jgi:hypothetical protein